jgi:hypothetical protein
MIEAFLRMNGLIAEIFLFMHLNHNKQKDEILNKQRISS